MHKLIFTMKKFLVLLLISLLVVSCSKIKIEGNVKGGSPLERIEFIEASGVATLPLVNIGLDEKGNFKGEFKAPKNGMYAMTYAGKMNFIFFSFRITSAPYPTHEGSMRPAICSRMNKSKLVQ